MEVFAKLLKNVNQTIKKVPSIVADAMEAESDLIIDLNVGQLEQGLDNEGELIEPEYATEEYAQLKKAMGSKAPQGTPDLILEGDFTEAFYTKRVGDSLLIDSNDEKSPDLERKYDNIFGLNPDSKKIRNEAVVPQIIERISYEITK